MSDKFAVVVERDHPTQGQPLSIEPAGRELLSITANEVVIADDLTLEEARTLIVTMGGLIQAKLAPEA